MAASTLLRGGTLGASSLASTNAASSVLRLAAGDWNDRFVVMNKRSGVSVYASRSSPSIESSLLLSTNTNSLRGRNVYFPHRLDKHSSGLVVVAFDKNTVAALNKTLAERLWSKKYRVLVHASPVPSEAEKIIHNRGGGGGGGRGGGTTTAAPASRKGASLLALRDRTTGQLLREGIIYSLVAPASSLLNDRSGVSQGNNKKNEQQQQGTSRKSRPFGFGFASSGLLGGGATGLSANFSISLTPPVVIPLPSSAVAKGVTRKNSDDDDRVVVVEDDEDDVKIDIEELGKEASTRLPKYLQHTPWKVAVTQFRLVCESSNNTSANHLALYEARPITGRTHQLRVHFSECGLPVWGDSYYSYGGLDNAGEVLHAVRKALSSSSSSSLNAKVVGGVLGESSSSSNNNNNTFTTTERKEDVLEAERHKSEHMGLQAYAVAFPYPTAAKRVRATKPVDPVVVVDDGDGNGSGVEVPLVAPLVSETSTKSSDTAQQQQPHQQKEEKTSSSPTVSSSSSSSSISFSTTHKAVRGANHDTMGRLLVNIPIPESWRTKLVQKKGSLVIHSEKLAKEWGLTK